MFFSQVGSLIIGSCNAIFLSRVVVDYFVHPISVKESHGDRTGKCRRLSHSGRPVVWGLHSLLCPNGGQVS